MPSKRPYYDFKSFCEITGFGAVICKGPSNIQWAIHIYNLPITTHCGGMDLWPSPLPDSRKSRISRKLLNMHKVSFLVFSEYSGFSGHGCGVFWIFWKYDRVVTMDGGMEGSLHLFILKNRVIISIFGLSSLKLSNPMQWVSRLLSNNNDTDEPCISAHAYWR